MRVLLVDDAPTVSNDIIHFLRSATITVDATDTGEDALELARYRDYQLVILDLMPLKLEAIEIVRRMRESRIGTPVLILSGLSGGEIKVKALCSGADDVLDKPIDRAELLARVQAIVRRAKGFSQPMLRVGPLALDLSNRLVFLHQCPMRVTAKEYAVLELLVRRQGTLINREVLLNRLYGGEDEPDGKIIDTFVYNLRKKMAALGAGRLIVTVHGRGFILRASADNMADRDAPHQGDLRALLEEAASERFWPSRIGRIAQRASGGLARQRQTPPPSRRESGSPQATGATRIRISAARRK